MKCYTVVWDETSPHPTCDFGIGVDLVNTPSSLRFFAGGGGVWAECASALATGKTVVEEVSVHLLADGRPWLDTPSPSRGYIVYLDTAVNLGGTLEWSGRRVSKDDAFQPSYTPWTAGARPLVMGTNGDIEESKAALLLLQPGAVLRLRRKSSVLYPGPPEEIFWILADEDGVRIAEDEREIPSLEIRGATLRSIWAE